MKSILKAAYWKTRHIPVRVTLLVLACVLLTACRKDLSGLITAQGPLRAVIYDSGQPSYERYIEPGSRAHRELLNWARKHSEGWKPSMITVKPGILLEGQEFRLIIRPEGATFIYDGGQFAKHIVSADYARLQKLLGGASYSGL